MIFSLIGASMVSLCVGLISYQLGHDRAEEKNDKPLRSVDEVIAHFEEVKR